MARCAGILATILLVAGCSDDGGGPPDAPEACVVAGDPSLELGVPDAVTFLDFVALVAGGDIPLSSNGQTFLAVQLAVRATNIDRFARIAMTVTYQPDVGPAFVATKDDSALERLFCRDDALVLVPVVVSSESLGSDLEIQDKTVQIAVTVTDDAGRTASAASEGILRRLF